MIVALLLHNEIAQYVKGGGRFDPPLGFIRLISCHLQYESSGLQCQTSLTYDSIL